MGVGEVAVLISLSVLCAWWAVQVVLRRRKLAGLPTQKGGGRMAAMVLSDDSVSRLVQLSAEYEGGWYGSGLKQKAVGFDGREREVSLFKVEGTETPITLTLTFEEMYSLVESWQAYLLQQEQRRTVPAPLADVDPFA